MKRDDVEIRRIYFDFVNIITIIHPFALRRVLMDDAALPP